jgi:UDPglucose 6-dehydrogenase
MHVCYNPEFIALGSVIRDFLNPDFYLLGEFDKRSGDILEFIHNTVSLNNAPVKRMNLENAELAKISLNSYVTMKISFANMLAEFCEKIPGGNVDVVSDAIGIDKRVGRKYLTGGLGFAGPCFPRDNVALDFMGSKLGVDSELLNLNHKYNRRLSARLADKIINKIPYNSKIAILGLSYKALSHIIEESPGIALCKYFSENGYNVSAHDNLALTEAKSVLDEKVVLSENLNFVIENADVILITTTDDSYKKIDFKELTSNGRKIVLVDYWRIHSSLSKNENISYIPAGVCIDTDEVHDRLKTLWL